MRAPLALALAAGVASSAPAQEVFILNTTWVEVVAGSITPVPSPNGILEPGEAARIRVGTEARINGANAVGQTTLYTIPSPGGIGTVRGLASVTYDLVGDVGAASANGTWGGFIGGLAGPIPGAPFFFSQPGTPQPGGSSVIAFGGVQSTLAPASANPANSNVQAFRGVWQPASYSPRTVTFIPRGSIHVPTGEQNAVIFAYGLGTDPNTGENYDRLYSRYFPSAFGNGVSIPIGIPAPCTLPALGIAGWIMSGRSRTEREVL